MNTPATIIVSSKINNFMVKKIIYPWERLDLTESDWRALSHAFYGLAHNDFKKFNALSEHLKDHPAGKICQRYIDTRDHVYVEEAGILLAGTKYWYVYLGRSGL